MASGVYRSLPLAGALLIVSVIAAVPVSADATAFAWSAPGDATGPGAFRAVIDFGEDNPCTVMMEGTAGGASGPVLRMEFGDAGWGQLASGNLVQVHANGYGVDTRGEGGKLGLRISFDETEWSGVQTFSILNAAMDGWLAGNEDPWYPATFDIDCASDITVLGLSGSRDVVAFDDTTLHGTGASANGLFAQASTNVQDRVSATFSAASVEIDISDYAYGGAAYSNWFLETPEAGLGYGYTTTAGGADFSFTGGPGDYAFTLDRVGAGQWATLNAWFAGFDPVADLGEIVA